MARLESHTSTKISRNLKTKISARKTKLLSVMTLLGLSGLITLSYLNQNIFMEQIAISGFIISCIVLIKIMETK